VGGAALGAVPFLSSVYRQIYLEQVLFYHVAVIFLISIFFLSMFGRISDIRLTSCCNMKVVKCKIKVVKCKMKVVKCKMNVVKEPPQSKVTVTAAAVGQFP
jgi:hypothetical protein